MHDKYFKYGAVYSYGTIHCKKNSTAETYAKNNGIDDTYIDGVYNLGEETYSFKNFGDDDSLGGHCFGMAVTSSGYYLGLLNKSNIGLNNNNTLYSFNRDKKITPPICYYQSVQGIARDNSIVAGGTYYKYFLLTNAKADWKEIVNYVKNHKYDSKGNLVIVYTKKSEGGHAINFLRFEVVDGQERIYAYDNNFPNIETYFYQDSNGKILQAPHSTFSGSIDCIALIDVDDFFSRAGNFVMSKTFYAPANSIDVEGAYVSLMCVSNTSKDIMMYEILEDKAEGKITPLVDNAIFTYMGQEYSFGEIDEDTYAEFTLSVSEEDEPVFEIINVPHEHVYNEAKTEPTCIDSGSITYTCICGDTYTETIEALGHDDVVINKTEATATENGYSGDIVCSVCGELLEEGEIIPATGEEVNRCDHLCHKDGILGFFWKIIRIFQKLFGMNPVCGCGAAHY